MGSERRNDRLAGALLGAAVGDALGLPREGLSPVRAKRLFGGAPLGYRFLGHRGMVSDDAEHAAMTASALCASGGDPERFAREMAWRMRRWFLALPAGVGWGTLRSCLRLCIGVPPSRSGVRSAGNGPAMRSGVIGAWCGGDAERTRALVDASTRMTHTHPRAAEGALLVALAAGRAACEGGAGIDSNDLLGSLADAIEDEELRQGLALVRQALEEGWDASALCERLGSRGGVSGYIGHTVPIALHCWLRHRGDFRLAVEEAILLGGDSDTVGSITGALAGSGLGIGGIPPELLDGLREWPRSVAWLRTLALRLAEATPGSPSKALDPAYLACLARNVPFAAVVLGHGLRRLLPPW